MSAAHNSVAVLLIARRSVSVDLLSLIVVSEFILAQSRRFKHTACQRNTSACKSAEVIRYATGKNKTMLKRLQLSRGSRSVRMSRMLVSPMKIMSGKR